MPRLPFLRVGLTEADHEAGAAAATGRYVDDVSRLRMAFLRVAVVSDAEGWAAGWCAGDRQARRPDGFGDPLVTRGEVFDAEHADGGLRVLSRRAFDLRDDELHGGTGLIKMHRIDQ
jgi:hypothetical protein